MQIFKDKMERCKLGKTYTATFLQMNGDNVIYKIEIITDYSKDVFIVEMSKSEYEITKYDIDNMLDVFCERCVLSEWKKGQAMKLKQKKKL